MKAILYKGPQEVAMEDVPIPEMKDGYTLIKVAYAGICGGDLNIYYGTHPRAKAPLIMGHEFSGTVVKGHSTFSEGTKVTVNPLLVCGKCEPCSTGNEHVCETLKLIGIDSDGAMGEYVLAPNAMVVPLPEKASLQLGALIEPIAVTVHTVRETMYKPGDSCVIFGSGTIGLCLALTLRVYGATNLTIVETNEHRLALAKEMGFDTLNPKECDVVKEIKTKTNGIGADFVYDCAGHQTVADVLFDAVKIKGEIIIVAGYKKPPTLNLIQGMFKEFRISFVRVYRKKDFALAGELLLADPCFEKLITHVLKPEDAKKGFDLLTNNTNAVKVLYDFT